MAKNYQSLSSAVYLQFSKAHFDCPELTMMQIEMCQNKHITLMNWVYAN